LQASSALQPVDLDFNDLKQLLAPRKTDTSKSDYGHVLVIGGDQGYGGAVFMAGMAAARCGAGLVSIATHPAHATLGISQCPELMCRGIEHPDELQPLLEKATVLVLGPGLGQSAWSKMLFTAVMKYQQQQEKPLVVDADALNLISQGLCGDITSSLSQWILTPHPGEAGRLLSCSSQAIQSDRNSHALTLQQQYGGVAVLKGAGSLIAWKDADSQDLARCTLGNPGMATGGMGDVLSGVIAALLAQNLSLADAAKLGVCLHALAGDLCAEQAGQRGMLATDLLPYLRQLVNP
jgi:NAD(P)H-hydrate epimerase